jgi:hypothetical protein
MVAKHYWLKVGACCAFLLLFAADELAGDWYSSFAPPWSGIFGLGSVFLKAIIPLPFIYLVILLTRKHSPTKPS